VSGCSSDPIKLALLFMVVAAGVCSAAADPLEIDWQLQRGFRYFKNNSDFEFQRLAYSDFMTKHGGIPPTIEQLDAQLNDWNWWFVDDINPTVASWYGNTAARHPIDLLRSWRKGEIDNHQRSSGYLELADALAALHQPNWEYYPFRLGWASLLFPAHQPDDIVNGTLTNEDSLVDAQNVMVCWDRANQTHSNCGSDYIEPKSHNVFLRALSAPGLRILDGDCTWQLDESSRARFIKQTVGASLTQTFHCRDDVLVVIPYGKGTTVTLTRNGVKASPTTLAVKDFLVVGLGDSFASGEGNPDVPAKLAWTSDQQLDPLSSPPTFDIKIGAPVRKNTGEYFAAQWIDRACHRSAYSYQARAAMNLALSDPHIAITYLDYACSGAEINEGLFLPWSGPEPLKVKSEMPPWHRAQIPLLLHELCRAYDGSGVAEKLSTQEEDELIAKNQYRILPQPGAVSDQAYKCQASPLASGFKRKIDLLYISIGGNDLGFSSWITAALTSQSEWTSLDAYLPVPAVMQPRKRRLAARYGLLREFIDQRLQFTNRGLTPVLLYSYPISTKTHDGNDCPQGNAGLTIFANGIPGSKVCLQHPLTSIVETGAYLNTSIEDLAKSEPAAGSQSHPAWFVINGYLNNISGRSYCASTAPNEPMAGCISASQMHNSAAGLKYCGNPLSFETLHLPDAFTSSSTDSCSEWRPYHPVNDVRPYAHRTRLFRTMNDVYLIINQMSSTSQADRAIGVLDLRTAARSGAFHPTAEAHAIIAQYFFEPSKKILETSEITSPTPH
jgi:hypothetical protein